MVKEADNTKGRKAKHSVLSVLLKYAIPLFISIGLCYLLFKGIDFDEIIAIVRRDCDFKWIAAALGLSLFSYLFRALRWRIQLEALGIKTPLFYLVLSMFGTYAVNLVLPRLGEVWRSGYIANRQNAPFSAVFGSMVAERLADTITVLLITLTAFVAASSTITDYLSSGSESLRPIGRMLRSPWLWSAGAICVAGMWRLLTLHTDNRTICRIQQWFKGLWKGFAVIVHMPGKGMWLLLTLCVWGCYFTQTMITFLAFPSTVAAIQTYGFSVVLVTFALSSLSMGVPSNGGIGPWQWAVIFALGIYGVSTANASAFANMVLGSQTLFQICLGIFTFAMIALDKHRTKSKTIKQNTENV